MSANSSSAHQPSNPERHYEISLDSSGIAHANVVGRLKTLCSLFVQTRGTSMGGRIHFDLCEECKHGIEQVQRLSEKPLTP